MRHAHLFLCTNWSTLHCKVRDVTLQTKNFTSEVSMLPHKLVMGVKDNIISSLVDNPFTKLKEKNDSTSTSHKRKLLQLLNKEMKGDTKCPQFLQHLQHLMGNHNDYRTVCRIFLQWLQVEFHRVLNSLGDKISIEKLAEIVNNITDLMLL